jgi:hypothetical protein
MDRIARFKETDTESAWQARNRQQAASYLRASSIAENAAQRRLLMQQAAELIAPPPADRIDRPACCER